jgi:hypothetical protein
MNVSNGNLVSSIACDDAGDAKCVMAELRAFKTGWNTVRSRGDRDEVFGGIGQSWKGCFVGGRYLVQAVTRGSMNEQLCGNFPAYTQLPGTAQDSAVCQPHLLTTHLPIRRYEVAIEQELVSAMPVGSTAVTAFLSPCCDP